MNRREPRIALTTASATSVVMLKALLESRGVTDWTALAMAPEPQRMLRSADACLLIGDDALRFAPPPSAAAT